MGVLESFVSFAKRLPADRLRSIEETLSTLMETFSGAHEFTPAELAELDRRVASVNPEFADPEAISKLFGKPFGG
jgi:hypothetical protein